MSEEWIDHYEIEPPENQWVEVKGYLGSRLSNPTKHYQGKARWYKKPDEDKEFFYWKLEDGQEYGSWYFEVEAWREITP